MGMDRPSGGIVDNPVTNLNKAGIETKDVFSEKIKSIVHKLNYLAIIHCSSRDRYEIIGLCNILHFFKTTL